LAREIVFELQFVCATTKVCFWSKADAYHKSPRQPRYLIIYHTRIPSLPNLISQFLINQQGIDIDFGEHPDIHTNSDEYSAVPDKEVNLFTLPKFHLSAIEFCISQGVLDSRYDQTLFTKLHDLHDRVRQINSLLAIEEVGMRGRFMKELGRREKYRTIIEGRAMRGVKNLFDELTALLMQSEYVALHGIDRETVVFP
jgi:hypothetical protein